MSHTCKALIIHCIDFRLQKAIKKYLDDNSLLGNVDIVSVAGAVKNWDFAMGQLDISKRLHDIKEVILMNHTDCGAYGGRVAFGSSAEESGKYASELKNAKNAIQAKYPELEIKTILAKISPSAEISFEEFS